MIDKHKITADHILIGNGEVLENHTLIIEESGKIVDLVPNDEVGDSGVRKHEGFLIPGLINTHCHLELSHMKSKIDTGTGLVKFISHVVKFRDVDQSLVDQAIIDADQEMYKNGIQAVGDICNKADTANQKSKSPIAYYSFIEMFDFMNPTMTDDMARQYEAVFRAQSDAGFNKKSKVPHAPYSVSPSLFEYLKENNEPGNTISIHNQETPSENEMFQTNEGGLVDFFKAVSPEPIHIPRKGINSINYALPQMDPTQKTLLVHNTMCTEADINYAHAWSPQVYWATCPNANLYIENRLPDYSLFQSLNAKMTIGTDSLTSNWQLSIWEEMKTIQKYQSQVDFDTLLQWATINGAKALSYDDQMGSIQVGKTPGILHVATPYVGGSTNIQNVEVERLM